MTSTRSPLHERHAELGAKFSEFGGWEMPLDYPTGVLREHTAVREAVGLFDVSHLGKLVVRGPGAADYVNACLSNDLGRIGPGQAQYTLCCDDDGGVIDDMIAYLSDDEHVLLVPNAANSAEVERRLAAELPEGLEIADHHTSHIVVAVQGPRADEVMTNVDFPVGHDYMSFVVTPFREHPVVVCRSGYTGERGYELVASAEVAGELWDALLRAGEHLGMLPCGLGARDTLRTEMGYPLHGNDLTPDVTPNQTRLRWAVGWKKPAFWGREALLAEREAGTTIGLRGLLAQGRGIARPQMTVRDDSGNELGTVTSGTFSPTLRKGIALAMLSKDVPDGAQVQVDIRGRAETFEVSRPPFVTSGVRES
ncbi:MAG: glycine cleavage system aminomethyltransferase GcvT [Marmoricola sp.]